MRNEEEEEDASPNMKEREGKKDPFLVENCQIRISHLHKSFCHFGPVSQSEGSQMEGCVSCIFLRKKNFFWKRKRRKKAKEKNCFCFSVCPRS